jgi:predicted HAD superfamily Cof-like phosphohydrolase
MGKKRTMNEYRQTKDAVYEVPKYDPYTGEKNPHYKELTGEDEPVFYDDEDPIIWEMNNKIDAPSGVQFVNEVEIFNSTFGKPNNYEPTIPEKKETDFVYDFCIEEINEYREACENGDIVEILDALCDIAYVTLGNGVMLHGLKDKIWPAYQEVQASNMSKSCKTEEEAKETVTLRAKEQGEECHFEKVGDRYVVYRSRDRKVMKSVNYFRPNLKQFFTEEELKNV